MDEPSGPATPPERVGDTLRAARERLGLSLAEIASRTRIPQRHLEGIEANDYSGLPSHTYATGFVKGYARAVGADEVALARKVRGEAQGTGRRQPEYVPYEVADPARVPSRGLAIVALGLALAVIVLAGLWFATDLLRPGTASAPAPIASEPNAAAPVASQSVPAPTPAAPQVLVTANDEVWLRIYDADGKTLHQGTLKAGEHFDVPAEAKEPMINVGRPDKITVTLNGSQLSGLNLGDKPIKDVRVSAAALQARAAGTPLPAPTTTAQNRTPAQAASSARPARPRLTETQRANLDAARNPPPPGNAP